MAGRSGGDPDDAFDGAVGDPAVVDEAWTAWHQDVAFSEWFLAGAADLGLMGHYDQGVDEPGTIDLRMVLGPHD